MKRLLLVTSLVLGISASAAGKGKAPEPSAEHAAKLTEYVEKELGPKIAEPAVQRMLQRLFGNTTEIEEEVREAVVNALSNQAKSAREQVLEMIDSLNNRDRAAFDAAAAKHAAAISSRKDYVVRTVKKLVPELLGRARPLARAALGRSYTCDDAFLGAALALDADLAAARKKARALPDGERTAACLFVRRLAGRMVVTKVETFMKEMGRDLLGEKVELGKAGERLVAKVSKALDRELIVFIGGYKDMASRIREGLQKIAETLPAAAPAAPAPAPAP